MLALRQTIAISIDVDNKTIRISIGYWKIFSLQINQTSLRGISKSIDSAIASQIVWCRFHFNCIAVFESSTFTYTTSWFNRDQFDLFVVEIKLHHKIYEPTSILFRIHTEHRFVRVAIHTTHWERQKQNVYTKMWCVGTTVMCKIGALYCMRQRIDHTKCVHNSLWHK